MLSSFCNDNKAASPAPPPPRFARYASYSGPPPPLSRWRKAIAFSRRLRVRVLPKPSSRKAIRTKSHSHPEWSAGRRRGRGPRHADGCCHPPTLRAWRAPQIDPLARTACFGRAAPPGAPPPSRLSAAAVDRRRLRTAFRSCQPESPAGVLAERIDLLCNGKRDAVSRIIFLSPRKRYHVRTAPQVPRTRTSAAKLSQSGLGEAVTRRLVAGSKTDGGLRLRLIRPTR
jgi:hypothetical protein